MAGPTALPALTSIRFFAAASIVLFHSLGHFGLPTPQQSGLYLGVGVDLFFALSGFILAYNYRTVDGPLDGLRMVGYRLARIWPLHIVTLLAAYLLLFNATNPAFNVDRLWLALTLTQSWVSGPAVAFHGNSVAWTLSVEFAFYLSFPILLVLRNRWIIVLTVAVTLATCIWSQLTNPRIVMTHPGAFFVLFSTGVLAARLYLSRHWTWERIPATVLEVGAALLAVVFMLYNEQLAAWLASLIGASGPFGYWLKALLGTLFFLPVIFTLAVGRGYVASCMSARWLVYLGEISFATYMCHQIILNKFTGVTEQPLGFPIYLALVLTASALLYRYVERPAQRIGRRIVDGWYRFVQKPVRQPHGAPRTDKAVN